ncbi:MAG: lytic murein transglycosylase [Alphaproteobacteria bacterium]|nr:lytic murein transglycosylase [Alphaproteobacteria bacterium]
MAGLKRCTLVFALLLSACAHAQGLRTADQYVWLQQIEQQAIDDGVNPQTVHEALDNFVPDERVIALDEKQPEGTISFAQYRRNVVTSARAQKGGEMLRQYAEILRDIQTRTGVPPQIVLALWGIESSFGRNMGDYETVTSLATLTYQGRRADFFRGELFAALHILDREHMSSADLRGSWAGAMGQCQFMPSTYLKYAVDGDGNGGSDIWNSPPDVAASIANYISAEGWRGDLPWGQEVALGTPVDASQIGLGVTHSVAEWSAAGVTGIDGSPLPVLDAQASLLQPDGADGSTYLVYDNVRALMKWNHSTYFALGVGLLADAIQQN